MRETNATSAAPNVRLTRPKGLPFAQVANAITRNKEISQPARLLYVIMAGYANVGHRGGYAGRKTLAVDMNCSARTITRLLAELESAGIIVRRDRYQQLASGKHRRTTDEWVLLDADFTSGASRGAGWADGLDEVEAINDARAAEGRDPWAEHLDYAS